MQPLTIVDKQVSNPKLGHTTGGSGQSRERRGGGAGRGRGKSGRRADVSAQETTGCLVFQGFDDKCNELQEVV